MSRKHKLRSRESNCAGGHDAPPRFKALLHTLAVKRRGAQVLFPRVHRGRCSPFIDPEVHNFSYCLERAILGLADYKFWCEVLVSAFPAMVSGNSFYRSCTELALVISLQSLPRLSDILVRLRVAVSGLCCVVVAIIACSISRAPATVSGTRRAIQASVAWLTGRPKLRLPRMVCSYPKIRAAIPTRPHPMRLSVSTRYSVVDEGRA
jgi:hypothetical protein